MSQIITTGWVKSSGWESESNIPTLWIGERNRLLGSDNNIDLVLLYGYDKLEKPYLSALSDCGYQVIDASLQYHKLCEKFKKLSQYVIYEKNCFLRWPIVNELYGGESVFHFDGDIVFNVTPEELNSRLGQKTFALQGCPGILSIQDQNWFEEYEKELLKFSTDIVSYSKQAWKERKGWIHSMKKKWAGARFREIIGSDQDLISHLIHTDRIIQDKPQEVMKKIPDMVMFSNPLYLFDNIEDPMICYKRQEAVDYINSKRVAFWHMQNDFTNYLRINLLLNYIPGYIGRIPNPLELSNNWKDRTLKRIHHQLEPHLQYRLPRGYICRHFFEAQDFSQVFKSNRFWKKLG